MVQFMGLDNESLLPIKGQGLRVWATEQTERTDGLDAQLKVSNRFSSSS